MENRDITSELAKQILDEAAARGISAEEFLASVIKSDVEGAKLESKEEHFQSRSTPEEWMTAFRQWTEKFPSKASPLSDYAVSRESIYTEREDSQL
jgi:hypothetical protein